MEQVKETPPPQYAESLPDTGSMTSMDESKRTYGTKMSKRKATPQEQALLLSKATSQATAAAKSILMSGGTDDTALLTARAAAESVLVAPPGERFAVFPNKRQAKQQAQVVASMALISAQAATNQFALGTEANIFMQAPGVNSFSGSRKSKPPSVIRQTSTCRREELSSVGYGESFTDTEDYTEKNITKALMKHARSNQSSNTNSGQIGGLPPVHPQSSPKSSQSAKKKSSPKQQYSTKEKSSPMSTSSRTNASSKSEELVVRLPGQEGSSGSKDSYFARRRAREQEKKEKQNLVNGIPDEDPIYDSAPQLDIVEDPSSYDTDENSRSVGMTDDEEEEEKSVSSDDAFESVDLDKKPKESPLTFSNIVDGMLCGACNVQSNKADERDDADDHSHDSENTDDSSREDMDDLEEPISPVVRSNARKWLPKSPKAKTEPLKNQASSQLSKLRKATPKADPVVVLSKDSSVDDSQPVPELKQPDNPKPIIRKSGNKKKAEVKKRIKESMEKVVLRAMASNNPATSIERNESLASKAEDSTNGNSSFSSKKSKMSRGARLSNWMRRKSKK